MSIAEHVTSVWDREILGPLQDYIAIPNVSEAYEADWKRLGHMERAVPVVGDFDGQGVGAGEVPRLHTRGLCFGAIAGFYGGDADDADNRGLTRTNFWRNCGRNCWGNCVSGGERSASGRSSAGAQPTGPRP